MCPISLGTPILALPGVLEISRYYSASRGPPPWHRDHREEQRMPRIRIGVVGCGLISQMMHLPHLRELADSYDVAALCDVSPAALRYVADRYDIRRVHSDYRDLLKENIDAVAVFSADSHGQVIIDALRAGKHVVTEKPMCYTRREADEILAAHEGAGTVCLIAY